MGESEHWKLGFKIENMLNQEKISVFKSFGADEQIYSKLKPGFMFQLKVAYTL